MAGLAMRAAYVAAGAGVALVTLVRSATASGDEAEKRRQRRGLWPARRGRGPWVWIHAASVGEADLALGLARGLSRARPDLAFVVSSMTTTGRARVLGDDLVESRYFPVDFALFVRRIVDKDRPSLFVAVETEIWPEALRVLAAAGVPLAVSNARISEESLASYRRARAFLGPVLALLAKVCARDDESARRWLAIGAREEAVEVTGNIKFDLALPAEGAGNERLFANDSGPPIVLAASTHEGEEALVLAAFDAARGACPGLRLVVAPRHPERAGAVLAATSAFGRKALAWSQVVAEGWPATWPAGCEVVVLDRLGLLRSAYASASSAFVGGSAVTGPGGHNLLEAVAAGCPVAAGPHLGNVSDQVEVLREAGALEEIRNVDELSRFWIQCVANPEDFILRTRAARDLVQARLGALDRNVAALLPLLGPAPRGPRE